MNILLAVAVFVLLVLARTNRIAPQTRAGAIERFGRHERGAPRG